MCARLFLEEEEMYLPTTAAEVKDILQRSSVIGAISDNTDLSKISVFNTQINALQSLYDITYNQAISFFNSKEINRNRTSCAN